MRPLVWSPCSDVILSLAKSQIREAKSVPRLRVLCLASSWEFCMNKCLTNATLVQLDPPSVAYGAIRVEGEFIAAVGPSVQALTGDEVVDCEGAVVMPGLVNGHTHLYSALAAGMPAPEKTPTDFHEILKYIWWRLDRAHDHASVRASGTVVRSPRCVAAQRL